MSLSLGAKAGTTGKRNVCIKCHVCNVLQTIVHAGTGTKAGASPAGASPAGAPVLPPSASFPPMHATYVQAF